MKSAILALATGLATLVTATSDPQCTCPVAETVTITGAHQPTETGAPGPGHNTDSFITVTITEAVSTVTFVQSVTVTNVVNYGVTVTNTVNYGGPEVPDTTHGPSHTQYAPGPEGSTTHGATHTQHSSPGASEYNTTSARYSNTTTAHGARQTHHVDVGTFEGKVQFVPDRVNAEVGDVVEYNFLKPSHSLTQSEFLTPCTPNGGFDTGLNQSNSRNVSGLFIIPFEVITKKPQWFFCKQSGPPNRCGKGMVFGLNPGNKMDQFIRNAIQQNGNTTGAASSTVKYSTGTATSAFATGASTGTANGVVTKVTVVLVNGTVLKFDPPFLPKVSVGQKIHFDFHAVNHTLTESSFADPCTKLAGTEVDTPFDLVIDSDLPRYFYSKQQNKTPRGHCGKSMIFSVNTNEATFLQFQENAKAVVPTLPKIKARHAA